MGSLYLNSKLLHGWNEISYKIYFILVSEYFLCHEIQSDEFLKYTYIEVVLASKIYLFASHFKTKPLCKLS